MLERRYDMGSLYEFLERFSAAQTEDHTLILISETLIRVTGCLNWARPGLRGLRVGNCQVLLGGVKYSLIDKKFNFLVKY